MIRNHLDNDTAASTINTLISSRLDNNDLLAGTSKGNIRRLQLAQTASAHMLTRTKKYDQIEPILRQLHWLPVEKTDQIQAVGTSMQGSLMIINIPSL